MYSKKCFLRGLFENGEETGVLVCFPFAGGAASAYNGWKKSLDDVIDVCPVQLPGREDRIMEKPYKDMKQLVNDIVDELYNLDRKIFLLGHSMGGKIAYEVARRLEEKGKKVEMLIVSGSRVPNVPEPHPIYALSDTSFVKELKRFDGMPKEILENKEILDFFLPMLRADFELDETYYTPNIVCLKCPILALGGSEDAEADEDDISLWNKYTKNNFEYRIFDGGHFFIKQRENEVTHFVRERIERCCS